LNSDRSVLIVCLSEVVTRQVSGKEVMKSRLILVFFILFLASFAGCHTSSDPESQGQNSNAEPTTKHTIVATSPGVQDVTTYRDFVCLIHSRRHIEVHALESGYLTSIEVTEGQSVKQGDVMFRILAALKKASLDAVIAEAKTAEIEFANTKKLADQKVVSVQEVNLAQAKLDNANAKVDLAHTELGLTDVKAAFDGMVDRQDAQQGSLISEGDLLTTLSDNTVIWVYFNVPEARYLEYRETPDFDKDMVLELVLANHKKFGELGKIGAIETDFNNKTGNISFRGDFSNPQNILRHGQTGTIRIPHHLKDVAEVKLGSEFYDIYSNINGSPSAAIVLKQNPGTNARDVISAVKKELEKIKKEIFPPGMEYAITYDVSNFLDASIDKVIRTLLEAFVLVSLVVFLFLGDFRSTLIPVLAVPVSLVGAFFWMGLLGLSINMITLFALVLAIGVVVDDAIVVVEAVHAKMHEKHLSPYRVRRKWSKRSAGRSLRSRWSWHLFSSLSAL